MIGSLDPSEDELELEDDFRLRLLGDAATTEGGFISSSSSEQQVETTVAPEQSCTSSKRSPHSMVAGRLSAETSAISKTSSSEMRLLVEND